MKKFFFSTALAVTVFAAALFAACGGNSSKGTFYTLQEAYEQGFLTEEDVMSIAYYHNGGRNGNEEMMPEDYEPQPKTPETLEKSTETAIKKSEAYRLNTEFNAEKAKASDVFIKEYDGTYNGCVVVMMTDNFTGYTQAVWTDHIAGIEIYYGDGNSMKVWRENK